MTERCQTKFTEKFDNQNYVIYFGFFAASLTALYFYRFHFFTIIVSYVFGCLACYFGVNSSILHTYLERLKWHFVDNSTEKEFQDVPPKGCTACGSRDCTRHDSSISSEPWAGLRVHKQLDQAIEDFYNTILDQFISSWYSKITLQPFFIDELRCQLRYASASLLRRAVKINYSRFITERLLPCALRHYTLCSDLPEITSLLDSKMAVHPAAANRKAELKYLRCITNAIMPYLLKKNDLQNAVFCVLIREIFAGWVLLSLTDVLADPYILNTLVILATGDETMAKLPDTPNYRVEFLETFVRQSESVYTQRSKLLRLDLEFVLNDQDYFYAFMQFMKTTSNIHLLQFYKDIKTFQTKILNPSLTADDESSLFNSAWDIYITYLDPNSESCVPLERSLVNEMRIILGEGVSSIKKLQTSRALYQAARQSHAVLEKVMLPRFLHSAEFYKLIIGPTIPIGYQKQMSKKPQEKLLQTAMKIGTRLRGALKSLDGQVLDSSSDLMMSSEDGEHMGLLQYLDSLAAEESCREQDLKTYKVVLTNAETRLQPPPRRSATRIFTVTVHRIDPATCEATLWSLERSEQDFHLLRSKLLEFHGEAALTHLQLPSTRDNSPLETLRYKYEDFIQRLLQKTLLQTSELLHLFLTEDGEFSLAAQASSLAANSTDLTNIYQSVTHKLRKEKGQHLESFLKNFLVSSDLERFQALKIGTSQVEEAQEVNEEIELDHTVETRGTGNVRNIHASVFGNNFDVEPAIFLQRDVTYQQTIVGFTQCAMYLLLKVIRVRGFLVAIAGSIFGLVRDIVDSAFNSVLDSTLKKLLSERRLAHLIRLGQSLLFGKKSSSGRVDAAEQRELARAQLLNSIPSNAAVVAGPGLTRAVRTAFEIVQRPHLNKQLVYNLLDLCLMELFPELGDDSK